VSTPSDGPGAGLTPRDRDAVIGDIRINLDQLREGGRSWRRLAAEVEAHSTRHGPSKSTLQQWWTGGPPAKYVIGLEAAVDEYGATVPGYPASGRTLVELFSELRGGPVAGQLDAEGLPVVEIVPPPGMDLSRFRVTFGRERDGRTKVIVTVLALLLVAVLAGVAAALTDSDRDDAGERVAGVIDDASTFAGVPVRPRLTLDLANFCRWTLGTAPIPLVSAEPLTMRIDARCNFPAEPDPEKDVGSSVYRVPSNDDKSQSLGYVRDGTSITPVCYARGDLVEDAVDPPNRSRLWIRIADPAGYVPNVNVGGGYTTRQLQAMGLLPCPAVP
jgi:hypothetical protein